MIKILLDDSVKKELIDMHWEDATKAPTGLYNVLNDSTTVSLLKSNHSRIYNFFYDTKGLLDKAKVESFLKADKSQMEKYITILGRYNPKVPAEEIASKELIKKVFRYDSFSDRNVAYDIMRKMDVRVCPYCNRQYTVTLRDSKVRPQFDHYFPKAVYPYLALTLFNLVPSCGICNLAKSSLDTVSEAILYPYEEEFGEDIVFRTEMHKGASFIKYLYGLTDEFEVKIESSKGIVNDKVNRQIERLHLNDLYNEHKDYIRDIAKNRYIYSDKRINELLTKYPLLFKSRDEVIKTVYMNDIRKDKWGKRPLAKLTKDIYDELKIVKTRYVRSKP